MKSKQDISVNIYGYFNEFSGLSESARSNVEALLENNVNVHINCFDYNHNSTTYNNYPKTTNNADINLFHININFIEKFIEDIGTEPFKNKYNIAYWAWEFEEPPIEILNYISLFNEIWVPSDFCVNTFNKIATIPVVKIPHAIAPPLTENNDGIKNIEELIDNKFVFLTIFDSISSLDRKNPFATINSFIKSFKNNPEVLLIIKTHHLELFKEEEQLFLEFTKTHSNIILLNKKLSKTELQTLLKKADCYISLHRSEGFGLTMAEAMSYEKLVLATGYSGNLEFMNINNSILVPYKLIANKKDYGLTKKGYTYADPDIDYVSAKMLEIKENTSQFTYLAKNAKKLISTNYSFSTIGKHMKERLLLVSNMQQDLKKNQVLTLQEQVLNQKLINDSLIKKINKLEKNIFIKIKYWYKKNIK